MTSVAQSSISKPVGLQRSADSFLGRSPSIFAVQPGNKSGRDPRGTYGFACVIVRAISKPLLIHRANHLEDAAILLRLTLRKQTKVARLRADKEHC
jgi:hypothetical protein